MLFFYHAGIFGKEGYYIYTEGAKSPYSYNPFINYRKTSGIFWRFFEYCGGIEKNHARILDKKLLYILLESKKEVKTCRLKK